MSRTLNYRFASGQDGLKEVFGALLNDLRKTHRADNAQGLAENLQCDILYTVGSSTSLIRVDINQDNTRVWHEDLMASTRPASVIVKEEVANFLKKALAEKSNSTLTNEEMLDQYFVQPSYEEYKNKQQKAGFFSGNKMEIGDDDFAHEISKLEPGDIERTAKILPASLNLREAVIAQLLIAQGKLDSLTGPAAYAAGGKKHNVTLFAPEVKRPLEDKSVVPTNKNPFSRKH
jgi:hypothetical protein